MDETNQIFINKNRLISILTGLILLAGNSFWLYLTISLFYYYNFTSLLFYFIVPTWIILVELIFSLTGIYIGQLIVRNKIKTLKWFLIDLLLVMTAISINYFVEK